MARWDNSNCGFQKGHPHFTPENLFKKGRKLSEETKRKISIKMSQINVGKNNPSWKGGRIKDGQGYILVRSKQHPFATQTGYVREHRLVIEEIIGKFLPLHSEVHHLGEISDNRPKMLMAFTTKSVHTNFEHGNKIKSKDILFDGRDYETRNN